MPPASAVSLLLSIFNSPLRYFLHPSKAAVIINESLPVLSALCMRALRLKAEGNGGWTKRGGATGDTLPRAQPWRGHWPLPEEPKILISSALPPFFRKFNCSPINTNGAQIRQNARMLWHFESRWGQLLFFFLLPSSLSSTNLWTQVHTPPPSLKICSRVCPLEFILRWKF